MHPESDPRQIIHMAWERTLKIQAAVQEVYADAACGHRDSIRGSRERLERQVRELENLLSQEA